MYSQPARNAVPALGPRVFRRWAAKKSTPRQGRKGHLYGHRPSHPPPTPEEYVRMTKRRMVKAERDERMDITLAVTPVKTYMGGFTRPRDLRSSNWFPGGRYETLGKVYESPPEAAYEPHTVYLLESRYPVKHGLGRVDCCDHAVGVCRAGDFEAVLRRYNSARAPHTELECMDNARWPWGPQYRMKMTKWWAPGENPREILKEIFEDEEVDSVYLDESGKFEDFEDEVEEDIDDPRQLRPKRRPGQVSRSVPSYTSTAAEGPDSSGLNDSDKPNKHEEEAKGDTGDTDLPKPKGKSKSKSKLELDPLVVVPVTLSTPSTSAPSSVDNVRAFHYSSRTLSPHNHNEDLVVPETLETAPFNPAANSSGNQKRTVHTSAVVRATEVPRPPYPSEENQEDDDVVDLDDEDGMDDFEDRPPPPHIAGILGTKSTLGTKSKLRTKKPPVKKFPKHGKAPKINNASKLPNPPTPLADEVKAVRALYLPTLAETPFWRPLLSITLSTRPLAVTLARLSRSLSRGLPFYASMNNEDRKTHASYSSRMRTLRIDRMENLTVQFAQLLAGARGGFIGIRFNINDRGRGVKGQGFDAPLPKDKRTIQVGVANWFSRAAEVKEAFREDAITQVGEVGVGLEDIGETFEITSLDEFGKRIDDKTGEVIPWPKSKPFETPEFMEEYKNDLKKLNTETRGTLEQGEGDEIVEAWRNVHRIRRERKFRLQELARTHKDELAIHLAQRHRSVTAP